MMKGYAHRAEKYINIKLGIRKSLLYLLEKKTEQLASGL